MLVKIDMEKKVMLYDEIWFLLLVEKNILFFFRREGRTCKTRFYKGL